MGDTADHIEACFRALLEQGDYRSVSVRDICERAGVSRKTFYVYYNSRQGIVERAFIRDVMRPSFELLELLGFDQMQRLQPNMHERQFRAISDDGAFYRDLLKPGSGGDDAFLCVAGDGFHGMNRAILEQAGFSRDERQIDYVAHYYASAKANLLMRWIRNDFDLPAAQLARLYEKTALPFWNSLRGGGRFIALFSHGVAIRTYVRAMFRLAA